MSPEPGQGTLFGGTTRSSPPEPVTPKYRVPLEKHEVKAPWGKSDKKGVRPFQKLRAEIEKLPSVYQERFNDMTIDLPVSTGKQFLKCLKMFMDEKRFSNDDVYDFDRSRGR